MDDANENCMETGKMMKRTVSGSFLIGLAVVMLGCPTSVPDPDDKPDSEAETYSVTYNGNGNDAGDVPSDSNEYEEGAEVIVLDNTGGLEKAGYTFSCWNETPDCTGTDCEPGESITMPAENIVLYARWMSPPDFFVTYNGNGHTGGSVPVDSTPYREGDTVSVLGNSGDLVKTDTFFVGWNPSAGGYDQTYHAEETFSMGTGDVELYARWAGQERILASDGAHQDDFGCSVSISGDYAVSGAPCDDDKGNWSGSAYIFHKTAPDVWDAGEKILAPDGAVDDLFGYSAAIDGDYVICGAPSDYQSGMLSGSAYIFRRTGTNSWDSGEKILAPDADSSDEFGSSVAISGDYAVVGAPGNDDAGLYSNSGCAYVFHRTGTNSWDSGEKLLAFDAAADDKFGTAVAISGDYVVVGAHRNDCAGSNSGSAYVFRRTGTNSWDSGTKLIPSDGDVDDYFGGAVAISGDYAVVGAHRNDDAGSNSGSAYVFRRTGTNSWDTGTKINASDGAAGDNFGRAVDISGDMVFIGAPEDDDMGDTSGSAYSYYRTGVNSWALCTKFVPLDGSGGEYFGDALSAADGYLIIGARWDYEVGDKTGSIYSMQYR